MPVGRAVVLVGNGPNRVKDPNIINVATPVSWDDVLSKLIDEYLPGHRKLAAKPFPLLYEQIAMTWLRQETDRKETELKTRVANLMFHLPNNNIHKAIFSLPVRNILTTNYDYAFECIDQAPVVGGSTETTYSLFRKHRVGDKHIWHIHGEARVARSILLGHYQYGGYVARILAHLHQARDSVTSRRPFSWVDLFLRHELQIISLGLDLSEFVLWWLLNYKARIQLSSHGSVGQTYFHEIKTSTSKTSNARDARDELLSALGCTVAVYSAGSHEQGYLDAIEAIRKRMGA